jgi:hypothetical protein
MRKKSNTPLIRARHKHLRYLCLYYYHWTGYLRYARSQQIGKPNNIKVFGKKKTKGHKQDS